MGEEEEENENEEEEKVSREEKEIGYYVCSLVGAGTGRELNEKKLVKDTTFM